MVAIKAEHGRDSATISTGGSRLGNGDIGGGFLTWDPGEATPCRAVIGEWGVSRGTRGKMTWMYGMRRVSRLDRPPVLCWVGIGFRLGRSREVYDAEIIAIFRDFRH